VSSAIAIGKTLVVTLLLVQPKAEGSSATKHAGCSGGQEERKCFEFLIFTSATEPSEDIQISLHFLQFLLVLLGCSIIPLAIEIKFLTVLNFVVKLADNLVSLKNFGRWSRFWDNVLQLVGQHNCLGATVANIGVMTLS
jgi:hypothetical protein